MGAGRSGFYVDYYDFVNVAKSFNIDDIKHIERSCKIERIQFQDVQKIEEYLTRIADEIIKHFSKGGMNIVFYNQFISEAKVAFYFARYVKISSESLVKILKALLFYFPEMDMDIGNRYLWTERLAFGSGLPNEAILVIEEFLISQADKHKNSDFSEGSTNNMFSNDFGNLLHHFEKDIVSNALSVYSLGLSTDMKNQVDFMYQLSRILTSEAKAHLMSIKKIESIAGFMDSMRIGAVERISDYYDLILEYMENRKLNILANREKGVISFYGDDHFVQFGILYFLGELTEPKMREYLGINDEYDLFVDPEAFDYNKLRPVWLKNYRNALLQKIAENEHIRPHVIEVLKERIINTNDKKYLEIFMRHFV